MELQRVVAGIDRTLDFLGYVPGVSRYSGQVRMVYGLAIAVSSLALQILYSVSSLWQNIPLMQEAWKYRDFALGLTYGSAQMVRGGVETLGWLGNIGLLGYDYGIDRVLNQRVLFPIITETEWLSRPVFNHSVVSDCVEWVRDTIDSFRGKKEVQEAPICPSPFSVSSL